jgi:hypothetical protein
MSLVTCLVTLNTKPFNLTKVAAICNPQNFRLDVFFYVEIIKCTPRHCLRCRQVIYKDVIFLNNLLASILALLQHNRDKDVNSCVTLCVLFQQRLICCRKRHSTQKNVVTLAKHN